MTAANDLQALSDWSVQVLEALSPLRRRALLQKMLMELRKENLSRMRKNIDPNGEPWEARKRSGRGRKPKKMMRGLARRNRLSISTNSDGGSLGFGNNIIASIHHYGLLDKLAGHSESIKYPERHLLGVSDDDAQRLIEMLLECFP